MNKQKTINKRAGVVPDAYKEGFDVALFLLKKLSKKEAMSALREMEAPTLTYPLFKQWLKDVGEES